MAFFDYALKQIIAKDNLLVKVNNIINWEIIRNKLDDKLGVRKAFTPGQTPYEYINLFKILLIQQWHNLSDPKMEESLKTRIDFMWFCNFGLATDKFVVPDETTICRFRNKLIKNNLLEDLLSLVNKCLEDNNLKVKISHGAILDATLIESSVKSKAKPNVVVTDRDEDNNNDDNNSGTGSKILKANDQSDVELDKDAKWLKKGKRTIFGYKNFVITDIKDGYIETIDTAPANTSEINYLDVILSKVKTKDKIKVLFTDKGYASKHNIEILAAKNIGNGIMDKATRNNPLSKKQLNRNKRIGKIRYIVERTNATTTTRFNFRKSKYLGLLKTKSQSLLVAIAHNLLKAANKIELINTNSRIIVSNVCNFGLFA
jgi:IS5 family transposase